MLIVLLSILNILNVSGAIQGGLFSAVLTAFNVQSYQLLTPPPATDPVIIALERISAQLSSFSFNAPSINSTHPAFVSHNPAPLPAPQYAVWLNALWFASLICSLSAASVGIMVKQWLNEFNSGLSGKSRQIARLRQLRLNSLERWRVKEIVAILPVLLQVASALFFAGLLVLLWQLNRTVAITATSLIGALIVFSLSTIIVPSFANHCAYLSPPSRTLHEITRQLRRYIHAVRYQLSSQMVRKYCQTHLPLSTSETDLFRRTHPRMYGVWKYIHPENSAPPSTLKWEGKELALLTNCSSELDGDSVATAYTTGMDTNYLHHASICITELTLATARKCFWAIRSANIAHWGEDDHTDAMESVHPCMWSGAIISLMDAFSQDSSPASSSIAEELEDMYESMFIGNSHGSSALSHTRLVSVDFAHIIRHYDQYKLPSGTTYIAGNPSYHMWLLMSQRSVGNGDRQQGECTIMPLESPPN